MNKRRMKLRTIVIAGAAALALIPALILGALSALAARDMVLHDSLERDKAAAEALAQQLGEFVDVRTRIATLLAEQIGVLGSLEAQSVAPLIARTRKQFPLFTSILVTDAAGAAVASEPPGIDSKAFLSADVGGRDFLAEARRSGQVVFEREVIYSKASGQPVTLVIAPIQSPGRAPLGFVTISVSADVAQEYILRFRHGLNGHAVVTTETGKVIAHEFPEVIKNQLDYSKLPIWQHVGASAAGTTSSYRDSRDEERFAGFATVSSVGWKVWVSSTVADVERETTRLYQRGLLWIAIVGGLAIVAAFVLARMVTRPIAALQATAQRIAGGDLGARATLSGPDEVATLARAVNGMAATLQEGLEKERTEMQMLEAAVREYGQLAARVAAGDLTARAEVSHSTALGELGTSLTAMAASLQQLVGEIREAASGMASAATEILAATSQQVSSAAEESAAVRQTAATVAQVRQTAEAAARKTRMVADFAQRVEATAEEGRESVESSVRGSSEARVRMEALAERILAFSEQGQAIAEINATVSELAEQSNLLAVNAAIEAAKAGESGKGFAVVAAEVKELAGRSKEATAQVRRIVAEIQKLAQGAVIAAEQGVKAADAGAEVGRRSGEAMATLMRTVTEASQAAQQIMAAADQQQVGMDQIALAMRNIEQSSTQSVAATQQVERAAKDLSALAQRLIAATPEASAVARA